MTLTLHFDEGFFDHLANRVGVRVYFATETGDFERAVHRLDLRR